MHQRPGKTHRASAFDGPETINIRNLINFMQECQYALEDEPDSAFYFEQIVSYLRDSYKPSKGFDKATRVLEV